MQSQRSLPSREGYGISSLTGFFRSLRALLGSLLTLAIWEAKQAGVGLALMLAFGLAGAMLVTIGVGSVIAAIVTALLASDIVDWPAALMVAAVFCFAGGGLFVVLLVRRSKDLLFKATRRQLGIR